MIDRTMRVSLLPAPLINKGFVRGEPDCNYEKYLLELVNNSRWFSEKYPGGFVSPISEANGECDAVNPYYQLDFKLFAAETALRDRNLLFPQVEKMIDGVTVYYGSRRSGTTIQATRLFAAFRGKSVDDLFRIRLNTSTNNPIENDINAALAILETQKNLMLYFPYEFSFDVPHDHDIALTNISEAIASDFESAFLYRKRTAKIFDTFLPCIYNRRFLIFKIDLQRMLLCEEVHTCSIPTYKKLKDYTVWW